MKIPIILCIICTIASCSNKTYEIAYASYRDKNYDIFLTQADSSNPKQITQSIPTEYNIAWSPDGQKLYYTVYAKEQRQIKAFDLRTQSEELVLEDSLLGSIADVSIDTKDLLISASDDHPKGELYLYNISSRQKRRISTNNWVESGAKFSSDGKWIVASIQTAPSDSINHGGIAEIFLIELSNNQPKQLTQLKGFNALPSFSPNGKQITFHHCDSGNCDIYVMNLDGTGLKNLTENTVDSRWPRWTPDGKWIAYTRTQDKNSDIYFISKDGKRLKPIITSPFRDEIAEIRP